MKQGDNWLKEIAQRNFEKKCLKIKLLGCLESSEHYDPEKHYDHYYDHAFNVVEPNTVVLPRALQNGFIYPVVPDKIAESLLKQWRN